MVSTLNTACSRRQFLGRLSIAGGAGLLGMQPDTAAAEPPPETTTISIVFDSNIPVLCYGPQYVAEALLRLEGFTDVRYAGLKDTSDARSVASGEADISAAWAGDFVMEADRGSPVTALSGMHTGCTEVLGGERVRSFRDLKGKRIVLYALDSVEHIWFSSMIAYIGLDPETDVEWVIEPYAEWGRLLAEGKVDAAMFWPPDAQKMREKQVGRVILNTTTDRPWRDYFCCIVIGNRDFVDANPVAAKRALRAMLKATDLCASDPVSAARSLVDSGFPFDYERAVQVFREIPYSQWREYDPEDTVRFFALRLRELGMVRQIPETLIARNTDWRFLKELKAELKG